jgi:hypothetical protein
MSMFTVSLFKVSVVSLGFCLFKIFLYSQKVSQVQKRYLSSRSLLQGLN